MKKWMIGLSICALSVGVLAACETPKEGTEKKEKTAETKVESPARHEAVVSQGDFLYRLWTDSEAYKEGDEITIHAELEYMGDQKEVTIDQAESLFYFPIREMTRGYEIAYQNGEARKNTTLKKGEPIKETYVGKRIPEIRTSEEHQKLMSSVKEGKFPEGFYYIDGFAKFKVIGEETALEEENPDGLVQIQGMLDIHVKKK